MIEHSIQNHPDVISMTNSNHFFKLFQRSHTGIDHKIIGCIVFVIGICHKYRILIDAIDSKLSDILYILTDSLYGSSKSVSGYHAIPCFNRFRHFNNTAFFRGKAIWKYLCGYTGTENTLFCCSLSVYRILFHNNIVSGSHLPMQSNNTILDKYC